MEDCGNALPEKWFTFVIDSFNPYSNEKDDTLLLNHIHAVRCTSHATIDHKKHTSWLQTIIIAKELAALLADN